MLFRSGQTYHIDVKQGTIWFQEMKGCELEDIHPRLEEKYPLYQRSLEIIKELLKSVIESNVPEGSMSIIIHYLFKLNNRIFLIIVK